MFNVPNLLSGLRIALVPALLHLAWTGRSTLFLVTLAVSLLSDLVDGQLARALDQTSELGARLDSWGDFATYMTVPICAWWLWPDLIRRETPFVVAVILSYAVPIAIGFLKYRRLTSYHTWGAKLSAVLMGAGALTLFAGGPAWPFRLATGVLVIAEIEEMAITAILSEWRSNVPSLRHAMRIGREGERHRAKRTTSAPRAWQRSHYTD